MRTLVIGYQGAESGHGKYCRTFVDALRTAGEDAVLHSHLAMPRGRIFQVPAVKYADRTARTVANAVRSIVAIRSNNPRVIHFQLLTPIVDRWWIPHLVRDRVGVLTVHNVEPHEASRATSPTLVAAILRAMDALVVHSAANKRRLETLYPESAAKISVIPHGVWTPDRVLDQTTARATLQLGPDRPVVLFFGTIRRNKGLGLLLEAFSELRRTSDLRPMLVVAGRPTTPDGFATYAGQIRDGGIADSVITHIRPIPEHEVATFYYAADVVALPYDRTFQAQSGVLFDAYAHRIPVVATNVGAIADTIQKDGTGLLADPDVRAFSLALARLLKDPDARQRMRERMRILASTEYSWETVAKRTRDLYASSEVRAQQRWQATVPGRVSNGPA